jgi:ATP-dependent Clp protease protease subunit
MSAQPDPAPAASPDRAQPDEAFGTFCGAIDQASVQRIFSAVSTAMARPARRLHILFQSTGGMVGDGVCLYNYFRTCPLPITLYNSGGVTSIAAVAYLGAKERVTSAHALFMIHKSTASPQFAGAARLKAIADGLAIDDERTEAILRSHLKLPAERWAELADREIFFSGTEAVEVGLATEIGEFAPPAGANVVTI